MSLQCPIGPEGNLLASDAVNAARLEVPHPVLTLTEMANLKGSSHRGWKATTLDATFSKAAALESDGALKLAIESLCAQAELAVAKVPHPPPYPPPYPPLNPP